MKSPPSPSVRDKKEDPADTERCYALTVKGRTGHLETYLIVNANPGHFQIQGSEGWFPTLVELVAYYKHSARPELLVKLTDPGFYLESSELASRGQLGCAVGPSCAALSRGCFGPHGSLAVADSDHRELFSGKRIGIEAPGDYVDPELESTRGHLLFRLLWAAVASRIPASFLKTVIFQPRRGSGQSCIRV